MSGLPACLAVVAGDSRALLVQRGGAFVALSVDHKPCLPEEQRRITDLGGRVIHFGRWRVEGVLAVSRYYQAPPTTYHLPHTT